MKKKGHMSFEVVASTRIAQFANKTIDLVVNKTIDLIAKVVEHTKKTSDLESILIELIAIVGMSFVQNVVNMRMYFVVVENKMIELIVVVVNRRTLNSDIVGDMIVGTNCFEFGSLAHQNNLIYKKIEKKQERKK